jgi:acyl-coenzyme A synthetase/AMP-(fatty) acid ligase
LQPDNVLMYPFVASWFARHDKLGKCDLSFLKAISTGGSVLDAKTVEILAQKLPNITIIQVNKQTSLCSYSDKLNI